MSLVLVHLALGGLRLGVHHRHMLVHIVFRRAATETDGGRQGSGGKNGRSYFLHRCLSRCPLPARKSCAYSVAEIGVILGANAATRVSRHRFASHTCWVMPTYPSLVM